MRVICRHGHFAFYPRRTEDVAQFASMYDYSLKREEDYFTFDKLYEAPHYSLAGKPYINLPAIKTYEGKPWDVMRENNFVYSIALKLLVPKTAIIGVIEILQSDLFYIVDQGLIQPGLRTIRGIPVMSYSAEIFIDKKQMRVLEYSNE